MPTHFEAYTQLLRDLDQLCQALSSKHAAHLSCQAGCSGCCLPGLSVFPVEAYALHSALLTLPPKQKQDVLLQALQAQTEEGLPHCPLLLENLCSVYAARPVICRTHGLPVHFQDSEAVEGEVFLDVCPLNFTASGSLESLNLSDTLDLERINMRLAAINHVFCRDILKNLDLALSGERVTLTALCLEVLENPESSATEQE